MNSKEIETAIDALLHRHGVTLDIVLVGERTRDNWTHDLWNCTLKKGGRAYHFEYSTGTGLRRGGKHHGRAAQLVKPSSACILASLCSYARIGRDTFPEFCTKAGCDEDSRKALQLYIECQAAGKVLRETLGADLLAQIEALVQEC